MAKTSWDANAYVPKRFWFSQLAEQEEFAKVFQESQEQEPLQLWAY